MLVTTYKMVSNMDDNRAMKLSLAVTEIRSGHARNQLALTYCNYILS